MVSSCYPGKLSINMKMCVCLCVCVCVCLAPVRWQYGVSVPASRVCAKCSMVCFTRAYNLDLVSVWRHWHHCTHAITVSH